LASFLVEVVLEETGRKEVEIKCFRPHTQPSMVRAQPSARLRIKKIRFQQNLEELIYTP